MSNFNIEKFYDFDQTLQNAGVIFSYKGIMSQKTLVEIGSMLKNNLVAEEIAMKVIKKIFHIFIEEAQNILKYSAEKKVTDDNTEAGTGLIAIVKENNLFYIISGNMIELSMKDLLNEKLTKISQLDDEQLKSLYKATQKGGDKLEGIKSAGLGFIDMARKSDKPIKWHFQDVDDAKTFFSLQITIEIS